MMNYSLKVNPVGVGRLKAAFFEHQGKAIVCLLF